MNLPSSETLPIKYLAGVFKDTTNSYKFYWFMAILENVRESNQTRIPMSVLISRMISSIWYPVNYFKISFGKQDRLGEIASKVGTEYGLKLNASYGEVFRTVKLILDDINRSKITNDINSLINYVPYRFIRPWFKNELRGLADYKINNEIIELAAEYSQEVNRAPIYKFHYDQEWHIEIHGQWMDYLQKHIKVLQDYCLWNLLVYLQKNNPSVPNIAQKLFPPNQRILLVAKGFWDIVINENIVNKCIYSNSVVSVNNYSIDHFIPWSFVTHDLLWNLIPVPKIVNSAKNDSLPSMSKYFDDFSKAQYLAFKTVYEKNKHRMLEDYSNLFRSSLNDIYDMQEFDFKEKLSTTIMPLLQIAENMGFQANWEYK